MDCWLLPQQFTVLIRIIRRNEMLTKELKYRKHFQLVRIIVHRSTFGGPGVVGTSSYHGTVDSVTSIINFRMIHAGT